MLLGRKVNEVTYLHTNVRDNLDNIYFLKYIQEKCIIFYVVHFSLPRCPHYNNL